MLICHCSVKGKPSHPHSVSQQAGRTGDIGLGCAEPSLAACGSHPGFSIPDPSPRHCRMGGDPSAPPRIHFCEKSEMKRVRCVMATTHWNAGTTTGWGENGFFLPKIWFSCFSFGLLLGAKFSPFKDSIFRKEQTASPLLSKKKWNQAWGYLD